MLNFEKIELLGFKSFADKVSIDLLDGITAIVGPNGCGKSNVADAIKWVLGEQSAKSLRGSSMQDVIFSGTQTRKSLSYCEVSLYFNNSEKIFPSLDYTEVVMTRKLFRDGTSEYYMNRQPCRLKDIIDTLHECGVSKDGYTIIGQGKVSEILSSKPEDRRAIFEEAVGIAKTKRDRKETMNKLARTNDNITRVNDILTERERQLEPLAKQAEKTRAYRALSEELKHHEVNSYLYKYENANDIKQKIRNKIQGYTEEIEVRNVELRKAVEVYNEHQAEISKADEYIKTLNEQITESAVGIEKQSGAAKVFKERISFLRSEIQRLIEEQNAGQTKTEELNKTFHYKKEYSENCNKEIDELTKKSESLNKQINDLTVEINRGEDYDKTVQSKVLQSVESLADIKQSLGALSSEESVISERQKGVVDAVNTLVDKYMALNTELELTKANLSKSESLQGELSEQIKDKSLDIQSTNEFIAKIDNDIYKLRTRLVGEETSLKFYIGLKESFGGFNSSIKNLLNSAKTNPQVGSRVKGVVASILSTNKQYETAIQTAIGGAIQNVVTNSVEDAEYLIEYLRKTESGRVTFLPVNSVKIRSNPQELILATREKGALGLATDLVKFDKYYQNIITHLLGGTLICDNLSNATQIAKKYRFAFKIVTLEGAVLSPSGSMTGGSFRQNDTNLLAVDRSVAEFTAAVKKDKEDLAKLESNRQDLLSRVNEELTELESLKQQSVENRQQAALLKEKVSTLDLNSKAVEQEIEKNKDEIAVITTRLSQIKKQFSDISEGDQKLTKERESASKEQLEQREKYVALRQKRDEIISENTRTLSRLSYLRAEVLGATQDGERILGEIEEIKQSGEHKAQLVINNEKIVKELTLQAEKVALSKEEQSKLADLRSQLNAIDEKKVKLNEMILQDNLKREVLQADINKSTERRNEEEINFTKIDSELEYLSQSILETYSLTYETCLPYKQENYDISMSNQDIQSLKRKISALGSINPNAIEEYSDLSVSYNELCAQRDDLVKAQDDLQKVIDDLTKEMTLMFDDGFKTIRSNFTKIFKELFGGGTADLIVEESLTGDPLDAGIEIVAEPPGKKLQKISLLSGGEMSLTAIAILFAILKLRPMPFCVLDEIEAALDDANVERFANYLQNFSKVTQFICITHKKVTMEHADGLFGVTMPEKGVSSIISVKLADVSEMGDIQD